MTPERCKEIPEDCWELILNYLPNHTHFEHLSLVSQQLLSLTNRLRAKISITDALIFSHPQISTLINKRFPNLKTLDFSNYTGNLHDLLLGIANSCLLRKLSEIDLSNLDTVPIRVLKEFGGIRVLKCSRMGVLRDCDLVAIADSLGGLEELDISYPKSEVDLREGGFGGADQMPVTDFGVRVLSMNVGGLRRVNVSGNHFITNRSLVCLSENCVFLEGVDVVDCTLVTAKGVLFLLRNSVNLKSVSVSGIDMRNESLGDEDLRCGERRLCSLDLRSTFVSDEFMHILVNGCVDLKTLKIDGNCRGFTVSSLELLLGRCQLQHLTLGMLDSIFFESIVQLSPYLSNLVSLKLDVSSMTLKTFYMVANSCPLLESVEMMCSCCGTTDSNIVLVKYANIRSLNLSNSCSLESKCLRKIALSCPNLEMLHISNCPKITEECVAEILDACCEIRHLSIDGCWVKSIGEGSELPKLELLNAARSAIEDEGLGQIAIRCPGVVKLDLTGCNRVTDSGVKVVLETCQILKEISLAGCWNVKVRAVDWMLCTRPSLVKIVLPPYTIISDRQKRFRLLHGCQIVKGSKTKILRL